MLPDSPSQPSANPYDVEVLTTDDVWSRFGPKAREPISIRLPAPEGIPWRRVGVSGLGGLCTLALHGLLLGGLLLGTAGRPPAKLTPLTEGAAASRQNPNATEIVSALIFLPDRSITLPEWSPDESAYALAQQLEQQSTDALIASLESVIAPQLSGSQEGSDESSPTAEAAGDGAGRALLFGRYLGQIKARIERAWMYPLKVSADRFDCRVQIKQDRRGDVKEVTLQRCGDDPYWQQSLVQAIQQASPLSGPPDESVFTEIVTLSFAAEPPATIAESASPLDVSE